MPLGNLNYSHSSHKHKGKSGFENICQNRKIDAISHFQSHKDSLRMCSFQLAAWNLVSLRNLKGESRNLTFFCSFENKRTLLRSIL